MADDPPAENVMSLSDVIERRRKPRACLHSRVFVDEANRVIECKDCGKPVDPFEAMVSLAQSGSEWQGRWDAMRKDWRNLANYVPHLRAVRDLEGMWRGKRLPKCPHCKKGVTAEGLNKMGWVHQAYAEAVEKDAQETKPAADVTTIGPTSDGGAG